MTISRRRHFLLEYKHLVATYYCAKHLRVGQVQELVLRHPFRPWPFEEILRDDRIRSFHSFNATEAPSECHDEFFAPRFLSNNVSLRSALLSLRIWQFHEQQRKLFSYLPHTVLSSVELTSFLRRLQNDDNTLVVDDVRFPNLILQARQHVSNLSLLGFRRA